VVAKSVSSIITLLRHALIAVGIPAPESRRSVVAAVGEAFHFDVAPFNAALDLREGRRVESSMADLYDRYMECVALIAQRIDQVVPKRQWQRVETPSP
jgi:hypothetical protein